MINTLSKIAMALSSFVVVLYAWGPLFHNQALTSRDVSILAINLLSVVLNGFCVLYNRKA